MVRSVVTVLMIIGGIAFGQSSPVTYTEVVTVGDSVLEQELYMRAVNCFAIVYRNANAVIQLKDESSGQVMGRGSFQYLPKVFTGSSCTKGYVDYLISIYVKDGRYKYEVTQFTHRTKTILPMFSFELDARVRREASNRSGTHYLIGWVGGYPKGSIFHVGWEFPRTTRFQLLYEEQVAIDVYTEMVKIVYGDRPIDEEVKSFCLNRAIEEPESEDVSSSSMSLSEFAESCGDNERTWGYDGDAL